MKLEVIFRTYVVRGEFEGQPFEANYSSDDGWNYGNGINCLNEKFSDTEEYEEWYERLSEWLWENGFDDAVGQ